MEPAHLTSIKVTERTVLAECDCGWHYKSRAKTIAEGKKDAKQAALAHWASFPVPYEA